MGEGERWGHVNATSAPSMMQPREVGREGIITVTEKTAGIPDNDHKDRIQDLMMQVTFSFQCSPSQLPVPKHRFPTSMVVLGCFTPANQHTL